MNLLWRAAAKIRSAWSTGQCLDGSTYGKHYISNGAWEHYLGWRFGIGYSLIEWYYGAHLIGLVGDTFYGESFWLALDKVYLMRCTQTFCLYLSSSQEIQCLARRKDYNDIERFIANLEICAHTRHTGLPTA